MGDNLQSDSGKISALADIDEIEEKSLKQAHRILIVENAHPERLFCREF
jgi:hypothetical protein